MPQSLRNHFLSFQAVACHSPPCLKWLQRESMPVHMHKIEGQSDEVALLLVQGGAFHAVTIRTKLTLQQLASRTTSMLRTWCS